MAGTSLILLFVFLSLGSHQVISIEPKYHVYLTKVNGTRKIGYGNYNGRPDDLVVKAAYTNASNSFGWDILDLQTNPNKTDDDQMYEVGYLEGYLTRNQIENHWINTQKDGCKEKKNACDKVNNYLDKNLEYIKTMTEENMNDPYWYQVHLFYKQFDGLCDGYNMSNPTLHLTKRNLLWQNLAMDVMELKLALANKTERKIIKMYGHCSGFIKLLPNKKDVLFGHAAWIMYSWMTRLIKRYDFSVHVTLNSNDIVPGKNMAFSSYPGMTYSMDDFYLIKPSNLVAIETTNNVYNYSLYNFINPNNQVLEGVRCTVANRLATDGSSWANYFGKGNSGTYNNQFMILDLNKFSSGKTSNNTLWLVEQMPGKIISADITELFVKNSMFASYNIPFFKEIYNYSGTMDKFNEFGDWYSHENCSRGKLFKRLNETVVDVDSMIHLLRYNHYKIDNESICEKCDPKPNPSESISARSDLYQGKAVLPFKGHAMFGAIDVKVSSGDMFQKGEIISIAGPSTSDSLPVFSWSGSGSNMLHQGQPNTFNFKRLTTRWGSFDYPSRSSSTTFAMTAALPLLFIIFAEIRQ